MLREYQLENFKAFAGPETIPVRPITLIYGPNSSGKSSILQSLLLLKQTLEEANDSTPLLPKGKLVDLGDYREFVHRHDMSKKFSFTALFTFDVEKAELQWVKKLLKAVGSAPMGLKVDFAYNEKAKTLVFSSVAIFVGNSSSPLVLYSALQQAPGRKVTRSVSVLNPKHDFWRTWWTVMKQYIEEELKGGDVQGIFYKDIEDEPFADFLQDLRNYPVEKAIEDLRKANSSPVVGYQNFLPMTDLLPQVIQELKKIALQNQAGSRSVDTSHPEEQPEEDTSPFGVTIDYFSGSERPPFRQGLDVLPLTFQVCSAFRQVVEKIVYIGPLRSYPERYYIFSGNLSEQVGQYGEMLPDVLFKNPEILKQINAEFERFQLGYELKLSVLKDEDSNLSNVFAVRVVDKESVSVSIRDVGFGVSQVLPIIVQSLLSQNKTLLIEQPEIHLHPALQAELGDLFIQSALGEQKNTFILETHSEHLLLRIMRRMRETANGTLPAGIPPVRPEDVSVLYVQRNDAASIVRVLELDQEGQLLDPWPGGFFEEGFRERFS